MDELELYIERIPFSDCWFWTGKLTIDGYGYYKRGVKAHRKAYAITFGSIPLEASILHTCHNRSCINPKHLYLGSHRDNVLDMLRVGHVRKPDLSLKLKGQILELHNKNLTQREIASELNCSQWVVWNVLNNFPSHKKNTKFGSVRKNTL